MSKSSKNSFLMQGMILAAASIVCRVIGLLYRSPLFGIIGEEGMGYYSYLQYYFADRILQYPTCSFQVNFCKTCKERIYQCTENFLWSISLCSCRWWYRVHDRIFWSTNLCWTSERCRTCSSGDLSNHLFLWNPWSIKRIFSGA